MNETNIIAYVTPMLILGAGVFSVSIALFPRLVESTKNRYFPGYIGSFISRLAGKAHAAVVWLLFSTELVAGIIFVWLLLYPLGVNLRLVFAAAFLILAFLLLLTAMLVCVILFHVSLRLKNTKMS
ncbi:MAG: hypothetical protein K9K75_00300 [Deltaproteobacteria bacterium]|nr:hypothetical protein [Deltaproteobacteria bacterium]